MTNEPFTQKERLTYALMAGIIVIIVAALAFGATVEQIASLLTALGFGILLPSPLEKQATPTP
jgi:hypothetical protein